MLHNCGPTASQTPTPVEQWGGDPKKESGLFGGGGVGGVGSMCPFAAVLSQEWLPILGVFLYRATHTSKGQATGQNTADL